MAEFTFSCPQCGQHIACDTSYSGTEIDCPSCQRPIMVPQSAHSAAAPVAVPQPPPPPPAPSSLATRQSTTVPASGRRFAGAPGAQPAAKPKSKALRNILIITAAVVVLTALGAGGWFGYTKFMARQSKNGNPAAQVPAPTAAAAVQALSILTKVHSAYTNFNSLALDGTVTLFLDLTNLMFADVNPDAPAATKKKNANRRQAGMPKVITNTTEYSIKRAQTNWYYLAAEVVTKVDGKASTYTVATWSADKGSFMFMDPHQGGASSAMYQQLAPAGAMDVQTELVKAQVGNAQQLFTDPAQLSKIIKNLGQTEDETVNGHGCYTLTAKVLGQKIKIWVDKSTYLISKSQITLGGAISDEDIDDAISLVAAAVGPTNLPPAQLNVARTQIKQYTPAITKIRGTITLITKNMEINPKLSASDFSYPVPDGVRLTPLPTSAAAPAATAGNPAATRAAALQNACINNLRQIDAAKAQWALEKSKTNGAAVTAADITPYLVGKRMPVCPGGGRYTIGKVGDKPTCSTSGHALP